MNLDVFSLKRKIQDDFNEKIALLNLYMDLTLPDHIVTVEVERERYTYDGPEGDEHRIEKVGIYTDEIIKDLLIKAIEEYFCD